MLDASEEGNVFVCSGDILQGYCEKQGRKFRNWKRRFIQICGQSLAYSKSEELFHRGKFSGKMTLRHCYVERLPNIRGFALISDNRVLLLRFEDESTTNKWFHKLDLETDGALAPERKKMGFLNKRGQRLSNWKKRWVLLYGNVLMYFKNNDKSEWPLNALPLADCSVELIPETKFHRPHCFVVVTKGELTQGRHLFLQASSEEERDEWVRALKIATTTSVQGHPIKEKEEEIVANAVKEKEEEIVANAVKEEEISAPVLGVDKNVEEEPAAIADESKEEEPAVIEEQHEADNEPINEHAAHNIDDTIAPLQFRKTNAHQAEVVIDDFPESCDELAVERRQRRPKTQHRATKNTLAPVVTELLPPSAAQISSIIRDFLLLAPPGEFDDVLAALQGLVKPWPLSVESVAVIRREWIHLQAVPAPVETATTSSTMIPCCEEGMLPNKQHYINPNDKSTLCLDLESISFRAVDNNEEENTSEEQPSNDDDSDATIAKIQHSIQPQLEHLRNVTTALPSAAAAFISDGLTTILSAQRLSPNNFWNGTWQQKLKIQFEFQEHHIELNFDGKSTLMVHYHENANVVLTSTYQHSHRSIAGSAQAASEQIMAYLREITVSGDEELKAALEQLQTANFKRLRRKLSVIGTRFHWQRISKVKAVAVSAVSRFSVDGRLVLPSNADRIQKQRVTLQN